MMFSAGAKAKTFKKGDRVRLTKRTMKICREHGIGHADGRIGKVTRIYPGNKVRVRFLGHQKPFIWSPSTLEPV